MFSRWSKIGFIGVPLLVMGAKQAYKNIVKLVHHTKMVAKNATSHLVMLKIQNLNR